MSSAARGRTRRNGGVEALPYRTKNRNMNSQIPPEAVASAFQLVSYVFTAVAALVSVMLLRRTG
jgi:hypothetical protein